ncbi:MFS transporter [Lysinibacillus fusiformis]|uniref:MFS transporter n=1 Tax=Lysinibacillus fusiformis TaxID=28031 RepID=UPI003804BE72
MSIEFQRDNYISVRLAQDFSSISLVSNSMSLTIDGIRMLSILTVVNMLFIVLFTPLISKNFKKYTEKKMYIGFLLFTIGYAVCSFSNNIIILLVATAIFSIGELIYVPMRQTILSEMIDENKRGSYMAFNSLIIQAGKFVASGCLLVSPYFNKYMMGSIVLIFGLISILFTLLAIRRKQGADINAM